jgi:enamine deaminase RidA (YjgF/YER057c/UK114 family)
MEKHVDAARYSTGTNWELIGGFSRAVRVGKFIFVSGTSVTEQEVKGEIGLDVAEQTNSVLGKIESALQHFGASRKNVVRTRIYIRELEHWESVAKAHGQFFQGVRPANTLVQTGLIGEGILVEIEADAILGEDDEI